MAAGTEAKEVGSECRRGGREGTGGRKLPPSLNLLEMVMRRRMKMRKRGETTPSPHSPPP
jgi:hypothetical protein